LTHMILLVDSHSYKEIETRDQTQIT